MAEGKLGAVESRFADIVWAHAPACLKGAGEALRAGAGLETHDDHIMYCVSSAREVFFRTTAVRSARSSRARRFTSQGEALVDEAFGGRCLHFWQRLRSGARSAAAKSRKYRR